MNYACQNCGVIGPNVSCLSHAYRWEIGNTQFPTIQSSVTWTPVTDQFTNASIFAEIGRLNILLHERDREIQRLKDLIPPDERGPGHVGQGSWSVFAEKVVAERDFLRNQIDEYIALIEDLRKKGVIDRFNRPLPLEGHHRDCGHGKDGWSLCTCDELEAADEELTSKRFKDLVEEGQEMRKEFDRQTARMRGPSQCSKCGHTGLVAYGPNFGMKRCDCKKMRKEGSNE